MNKLYLDGCSYTFGLGLNKSDTLETLFTNAGYEVTNQSRPGKSNMAITLDTFNNINSFDVYILGFTYSSRFYLKFRNDDIDILNTRYSLDKIHNADIESAYENLHKSFYTLHDTRHWDNVSNMLVDNLIANLKFNKKKIFVFSWEHRISTHDIYYPVVLPSDRLDDRHLNKVGTKKLFDYIQNKLGNA